MNPGRTILIASTLACFAFVEEKAVAADVVITPASGSGLVVKDAGNATERFRANENGNVWIPILATGAQQSTPVCSGTGGILGPCASGGGSTFTLPYAQTITNSSPAFAITNNGGDALNGFTGSAGNSGVYGLNSAGGKGVFGVSSSGNGIEGGSTSGSGVKGATAGTSGLLGAAGVWGDSGAFFGVWGTSTNNDGVQGSSTNSDGVAGASSSTTGGVGVRGLGNGVTWGVVGNSGTGNGVFGQSAGAGVWGESTGYDAVHGHTSNANGNTSGVAGFGDGSNNGTFGISASGSGVAGFSTSGAGVYAHSSSGYGIVTDGSVQQARTQGGWVKAMVYAVPVNLGGSGIVRCYNSQLPADQASVPPCGFVYGEPTTGIVTIDFGFEIDDRFLAATPSTLDYAVAVGPQSPNVVGLSFSHYVLDCSTDYTKEPPKTTCSIDNIGRDDGAFNLIIF